MAESSINPKRHKVAMTVADRKRLEEKYSEDGVKIRPRGRKDKIAEIADSYDFGGGFAASRPRKGLFDLPGLLGLKPRKKAHGKSYKAGTSLNPETSGRRRKGKGGLSRLR